MKWMRDEYRNTKNKTKIHILIGVLLAVVVFQFKEFAWWAYKTDFIQAKASTSEEQDIKKIYGILKTYQSVLEAHDSSLKSHQKILEQHNRVLKEMKYGK